MRFYDLALKSDHTFHRTRKDLWEVFVDAFTAFPQPGYITLLPSRFNAIKGYLCSRNEMTNSDDKRLAFETALYNVYESVVDNFKLEVNHHSRRKLKVPSAKEARAITVEEVSENETEDAA